MTSAIFIAHCVVALVAVTARAVERDTGMAILVIDKSLKELSMISDKAAIVERGKTVWQGAMGDLTPDITEKYVGI